MNEKLSRNQQSEKKDSKVAVRNINVPGQIKYVDSKKYHAMCKAFLKVIPEKEPGMNQSELKQAVIQHLPEDLFPGGETAGWWSKTVQLDLEAKGIVRRLRTKPLSWVKT